MVIREVGVGKLQSPAVVAVANNLAAQQQQQQRPSDPETTPERVPGQGRASATPKEEEGQPSEPLFQQMASDEAEPMELPGSLASQSDDSKLTIVFHSKFHENYFLIDENSITHNLPTNDLKEVCNYIKRRIQIDIGGTNYGIQHCLIENGPENDKIDIINLITNKEDLEDNHYKIMAGDENAKLKVIAKYLQITEYNKTEITTADDITINSNIHRHKRAYKSNLGWAKYEKPKQKNCPELNDKLFTVEKKDAEVHTESNQTQNGSDLNEIHLINDGKKFNSSLYSRDIQRYDSDKYESIESNDSVFYNNSESSKIHFVGLVNQAMTCYLNSLLQALYMTPEFRNALYNWEYKDTDKDAKKNIPFQLQKLFLNLQTSEKSAETTALTHSFGWEATEAWNQHDIQELCRVMFDALEKTFKNTKQADFINRLYEGKILDYVKCLTCNLEKSREDSFLDIPLPLRSFDGSVTYGSVEEALEAFVKYETLEGNNQYFCEKCDKKSNAHKGLKFSKFPYILTLQLKRFDFDHTTFHRIKLNDKVTFPDKLNLNLFIASNPETPSQEEDAGLGVKCDDNVTDNNINEESSGIPITNHSNHITNSNHDQDDDEGIEMCNGVSPSAHSDIDKMREHYAKAAGPYVYELFCIMIHSGSASGGHYYAYIKDFRNNKWWCFDDQRVSHITEKDIQNTYGGSNGKALSYSSVYRSSTNAYMLMYRQIDSDRNALPMEADNFPPHLKNLLERMRKCEEDNSYLEQECLDQLMKIEIYLRQPKNSAIERVIVAVSMSQTLGEIAKLAINKAGLENTPADCARIVVYNRKYNLVERVLDSDKRLDMYFENPSNFKDLMLDVRQPNEEFESYPSNPLFTKVYLVNHNENELIDGPKYVRAYAKQSIREYKQELKKYFNIDPKVVQLYSSEIFPQELMKDDDKFENKENISDTYVYRVVATEFYNAFKEKFQFSDLSDMCNRLMNTVTFYLNTFEVTTRMLEKCKIPSLENYYREDKTRESASNHNCLTEELAKIHVDTGLDTVDNQFTPAYDKGSLWNSNYVEANNSEDSSLSDSDKTIVNEEMIDNTNMNMIEDMAYISTKDFDVEQSYMNKTNNDEHPASDVIFKIKQMKQEKTWCITMDKEITEEQLKERLEQYIKVPKNYFKIMAYSPECPYTSLFKDDKHYVIHLGRVLQPGENSVEIYMLKMGDSQALHKLLETGLSMMVSVGVAKQQIFSELRKIGSIDLPYENLRFIELNGDDVGEELDEDDKHFKFSNNICIQELPLNDNHDSSNYVQVHIRRWNRSKMQLDDPQEISVPKSSFSKELRKTVSAMSNISDDCLEFSVQVARKVFRLDKMESSEWKTEVSFAEVDFKTYIIYRDSKEAPKEENEKIDWNYKRERYPHPLTGGSFSRREKALKIHVDT